MREATPTRGSFGGRGRPLRILVALQYYLPHRTGLTLHVQRVVDGLAARGHELTVLTARFDRSLPRDDRPHPNVRVVRVAAPLRVSRGMVMPTYPAAVARLICRHDVVSLHTPALETAVYAPACRLARRGLVITHHGDLRLPAGAVNRFVERFTLALFRAAGRQAHRVIAYSDDYARASRWLAPFADRVEPVWPPIAIPEPDPGRVRELRAQWLDGAPEGAKLVGYAGRFVEEKRPDLLIRALPTLHRTAPGSRVVFAGQYRLRYERYYERHQPLVEDARKHLRFLDLLHDEAELAAFYAACDVVALPSDSECFGLVQAEAMCCGTPVVATDIPGARVVVRRTGMGELVSPGDPEALGEALGRVAAGAHRLRRPREEILAAFDLGRTLDAYERLLTSAADGARR